MKFTVEAYPDTFTASVAQVRLASQLTDNVVNYTVVVNIDNKDGRLLPGMTATVQFVTGLASNVLVVPNLALRYKPDAAQLAAAGAGNGAPTTGTAANRSKRPASGGAKNWGTVYTLDNANKLRAIRVRAGLSDGQHTQVTSDSLSVGTPVIIGVGIPTSGTTAVPTNTNPLTPQRPTGGGGRGGP